MNVEALKELAAKVEAGNYDHFWEGDLVERALGKWAGSWKTTDLLDWIFSPHDLRQMGAVKALHDAVLPGWTLNGLREERHPDKGQHPSGKWECLLFGIVDGKYFGPAVKSSDPARAWLLAILRALIAQEESK